MVKLRPRVVGKTVDVDTGVEVVDVVLVVEETVVVDVVELVLPVPEAKKN